MAGKDWRNAQRPLLQFGAARCASAEDRRTTEARSSLTRQAAFFSKEDNSPRRPEQWGTQGMSATIGSANSQSASEQGGSAKRERALRTRLASSGGQLTKRTEQGARRAQARATCFGSEALVLTAKNRKVFQESCAGSCRAMVNMTQRHSLSSTRYPTHSYGKNTLRSGLPGLSIHTKFSSLISESPRFQR